MCGIAGFIDQTKSDHSDGLEQTIRMMTDSIRHRGPDDGGSWQDTQNGLALGYRRLAIIDLSPAGQQPMTSQCQRYVIVYNGEVYNAKELATELVHVSFRGHSDTEVVLEACAHWGIEKAVTKLNGMFGFAIWDRKHETLSLVRDRLGIKPLYWGKFNNLFLFASELKALKQHPGWKQEIDPNSLSVFMKHRYIPAPHSIFKGIKKLEPGKILTLGPDQSIAIASYWNVTDVVRTQHDSASTLSDNDAIDTLDTLLGDAVNKRMIADVPLGAFLSGGIDSAAVVAMMQKHGSQQAKTFTIGFNDTQFNEANEAKAVARHLNTEHTELYVGPQEARDVIPLLPGIYDEPFADSSQIPTYLVSRMTQQHVTVALSGDGGDELFAGYNRYQTSYLLQKWTRRLKGPLSSGLRTMIESMSPAMWNKLLSPVYKKSAGHKLYNLANFLRTDPDFIYSELISERHRPEKVVENVNDYQQLMWASADPDLLSDPIENMQYLDMLNYLPDNILTKVDRASMAVSLEARTPILDHRIVEFAWSLPLHMKIRNKEKKWLLRQLAYRYVPRHLLDRRKSGFKIPVDDWMREPLRDWAESLLDEKKLREQGIFNTALIRKKWEEHLSGERNWKGCLWNVLMFQSWMNIQQTQ